jgi:hypothetical protein
VGTSASVYQQEVKASLRRYFNEVQVEWSITTGATDSLSYDSTVYAPRVDVAVGPFNTTPGDSDGAISEQLLPARLRDLFRERPHNPNPRCLLAIEVCYSGSSKHIMGDMLNAGALGLYGLVVGAEPNMAKIRRILRYLEVLADLDKVPWLFRNVVALSTTEFDRILVSSQVTR